MSSTEDVLSNTALYYVTNQIHRLRNLLAIKDNDPLLPIYYFTYPISFQYVLGIHSNQCKGEIRQICFLVKFFCESRFCCQ